MADKGKVDAVIALAYLRARLRDQREKASETYHRFKRSATDQPKASYYLGKIHALDEGIYQLDLALEFVESVKKVTNDNGR